MATLDISTFSGHLQSVELDRRQAISIGAHSSNDVQVEGDDVEIMHCRISWNKTGFEVVAAGMEGVDLNGHLVQKAMLQPDDVLRIGDCDIKYLDVGGSTSSESDASGGTFDLKPLSGELDGPIPPAVEKSTPDDAPLTAEEIETEEPPKKKRKEKPSRSKERRSKSSREKTPRRSEDKTSPRKSSSKPDKEASDAPVVDFEELPEVENPAKPSDAKDANQASKPADDKTPGEPATSTDSVKDRLRGKLHSRAQRPGERDAVRSPLVLTLGGGAVALLLIGLTFYFIIDRQTTQAQFDEAQGLLDEEKFTHAIKSFEQFIVLYPRDQLVEQAKVQLGISKIENHISGASPKWAKGLNELNGFINDRRDLPDFEDHRDGIRRRAERIAEGAALTAGKTYDRSLLDVSDEARNLLTRFSPKDAQPAGALKRIQSAWRASEAAILKHETMTKAVADIDQALKDKRPMDALVTRRELLRRYPDFASHRQFVGKLAEILKAEQSLITLDDTSVDAVTEDHPTDFPPALVLTFHARSRTDEVSVGRMVYGIGKDCCYALDSITGEPLWRRVIGADAPFLPTPVNAAVPALLVFAPRHDELQLLDQKTGALLWRQPEVRGVTGGPTVEDGQAYVIGSPGTLYKIDLVSGQVTSRLSFSQELLAPVTPLLDGSRLVIAGSQEVVYTLTNRPLECVAVTYFGHRPNSVVAPLLTMGALLLMCENRLDKDQVEVSRLRVLDTRDAGNELQQIATSNIPGHVIDPPVIRGRDVFVPSTGERVSAFSASDEPGQEPLTVGPRYEPEAAEQSAMFLATGPDRQVWMASRYLRKLQLTTDAVQPGSKLVNIGVATRPIQLLGKKIYISRAQRFSTATTLLQTDRDNLTSDWQTVVGARLLAWGSYPGQSGLVAVNESGDVFRISDADIQTGGFLRTTTVRLNLPEELEVPLGARQLSDGQIAVWCGDPQPQLWLVNRVGQTNRPRALPGALQCDPVLLGDRIVLPLSGKLHLLRAQSGQTPVQDFSLPASGEEAARWRQLVSVSESAVVAATEDGTLRLIRLQSSPKGFLSESGLLELGEPLAFQMDSAEGMLAVATGRKLQLMDGPTLEPRAETELPGPVSNDLWFVGDRIFVETARSDLHIFSANDRLQQKQTIPLGGTPVAGSPFVAGDRILIPLQNGGLLIVDAQSGEIVEEKMVGQALDGGLRQAGEGIMAATTDGSLVRLGAFAGGN